MSSAGLEGLTQYFRGRLNSGVVPLSLLKGMKSIANIIASLILSVGLCFAQEPPSSSGTAKPDNCEGNMARLDSIRIEALNGAGKDAAVIVIARLGRGEVSHVHNRNRLSAAGQYFSQYGLPVRRIVLAEGGKADGFGRVEFYVAGELEDVLLVNRNRGLCIECCNPRPEDFTSYRKRKRRR